MNRPHFAAVALLAVYLAVRVFWLLSGQDWRALETLSVEALIKVGLWVIPSVGLLAVAGRQGLTDACRALGLTTRFRAGVFFGLAATLPMAGALALEAPAGVDLDVIVSSVLLGPFAEEVLFRGFLFLALRRAGWRFWTALLVSSAAFGLAHLPNVDASIWRIIWGPSFDIAFITTSAGRPSTVHFMSDVWFLVLQRTLTSVAVYAVPYAVGGALFGWVLHRWNSLWPAVGLHAWMNFWWDLSHGEHTRLVFAVDPMSVAQAGSAVLAILITLKLTSTAAASVRIRNHAPTGSLPASIVQPDA